jgi:hypothetical protein
VGDPYRQGKAVCTAAEVDRDGALELQQQGRDAIFKG